VLSGVRWLWRHGTPYVGRGYRWGELQDVTFTRVSDASSQTLMNMAGTDNHTVTITESYSNLGKTVAVVTLQMTGVRITSVKTEAGVANPNGPEETVAMHLRTIKYTFQPYSQTSAMPAGAPVTVSYPPFPQR
jgi:type VI protein secretion system component Hcp